MARGVIRLALAGVDTLSLSPLCARCPQGRAGCCEAPPAVAWADIGRIVLRGGRDFLLEEIRQGRLLPSTRGLTIRRVPASDGFPERCGYLGPSGCVLQPERRAATCNYYLCEDALAEAEKEEDPAAPRAREAGERLALLFGRFDLEIAEKIGERFPSGLPWDAEMLDWLGGEVGARVRRSKRELRGLFGAIPRPL